MASNLVGLRDEECADEPMISIFFASPFLSAGDRFEEPLDRLTMWRDISKRFLGREAEEFDAAAADIGAAMADTASRFIESLRKLWTEEKNGPLGRDLSQVSGT